MSQARAVLLIFGLACALAAGPSRGDGAFPDSFGVLLPSDQPNRIIASTNFGLLVSDDAGASWQWICEQAIGLTTFLYESGPAPDDWLYAESFDGLTFSSDMGCTWNRVQGQLAGSYVTDVFPDPTNSRHALAIARVGSTDGGTPPQGVFESFDSGRTFPGAALYLAPDTSTYLSGVEIARSNPNVYFVTQYTAIPIHPYIAHSIDRGATWVVRDLGSLGAKTALLLAGDPSDAQTVYLRLSGALVGDKLAISNDSGVTARVVLEFPSGRITAFLRRSDGALVVASGDGSAFISTNRGASFTPLSNSPHLRGLGERNGLVYGVADDVVDGFALGVSANGGASWQPLLRFAQLLGPKQCGNLPTTCAAPWEVLKATLGIGGTDGGTGLDGGTGTAPRRSGCSSAGDPESFVPAGCLLIAMLWRRRHPRQGRKRE